MKHTMILSSIFALLLMGCVITTVSYDGSKRYIFQEGSGQYVPDYDEHGNKIYFFSFPFKVYNPTNSTVILKFQDIGIEYSSRKSWFDENKKIKIWEKSHKSLNGDTIECLSTDNKSFFNFFILEPWKVKYFWLCSRDRPNSSENVIWYYVDYLSCKNADVNNINIKTDCIPEYYSLSLTK
ncbi:MAG: hypothetical protein AABX33_05710 [Nanoarchaeota archaeon]